MNTMFLKCNLYLIFLELQTWYNLMCIFATEQNCSDVSLKVRQQN